MKDLVARKRQGGELSEAEIQMVVSGYARGDVPDYQMAALLMAICFQGMTLRETTALTAAMANSGAMLDLGAVAPYVADKHSTGGVGDKASLVVGPLAAVGRGRAIRSTTPWASSSGPGWATGSRSANPSWRSTPTILLSCRRPDGGYWRPTASTSFLLHRRQWFTG